MYGFLHADEYLRSHYNLVLYYTIGTLGVMVVLLVMTQCYIRSVKDRSFDYDYKSLT